jgi:hypothetical protein
MVNLFMNVGSKLRTMWFARLMFVAGGAKDLKAMTQRKQKA